MAGLFFVQNFRFLELEVNKGLVARHHNLVNTNDDGNDANHLNCQWRIGKFKAVGFLEPGWQPVDNKPERHNQHYPTELIQELPGNGGVEVEKDLVQHPIREEQLLQHVVFLV